MNWNFGNWPPPLTITVGRVLLLTKTALTSKIVFLRSRRVDYLKDYQQQFSIQGKSQLIKTSYTSEYLFMLFFKDKLQGQLSVFTLWLLHFTNLCTIIIVHTNRLLRNTLSVKKEVGQKWLIFGLWLKFRPTKNFKCFVFYCYYWELTKFSTD